VEEMEGQLGVPFGAGATSSLMGLHAQVRVPSLVRALTVLGLRCPGRRRGSSLCALTIAAMVGFWLLSEGQDPPLPI